ncbi:MAG: hypothetical protein PHV53_09625 [Fermentimonas sp.]|nr:hypothetical protein [Fermentimonas sp.]
MRAKRLLKKRKINVDYYDVVKKTILDLYPLRTDKSKTFKYFNRHLFADQRLRSLTENTNEDNLNEKFELRKGEVNHTIAYQVRMEVLQYIMHDDSFIYAQNIIVLGENNYTDNHILSGYEPKTVSIETIDLITELIRNYKEDYPKTNLCEYLTDDDNKKFYDENSLILRKDDIWWLKVFNIAYEVFDYLRVNTETPSEAYSYVQELDSGDELLDSTVKEVICYLAEKHHFEITKKKSIMLNILSGWLKNNYIKPAETDVTTNNLEEDITEYEGGQDFVFDCSQQTKGLLLLFDALGVNEDNTKKSELAKLIQLFTGKNLRNIQNRMKIDFDRPKDVSDLKLLSAAFRETFPAISKRIDNDFKPDK